MQYFGKGHRRVNFPKNEAGKQEFARLAGVIDTYYDRRFRDQPLFEIEVPTETGWYRYKILNRGDSDWIVISRKKAKK